MAALRCVDLRDMARAAASACGARGFMRFADGGEALLVTDAALREKDGGEALCAALARAGFVCRAQGKLLGLTPGDALLERLCESEGRVWVDWNSPLHPAQALGARLMRDAPKPLNPKGRQFVLKTARLLWQPQERVLAGLAEIRAMAAVRMREGERNGFYQAGSLLFNWCLEQAKEER